MRGLYIIVCYSESERREEAKKRLEKRLEKRASILLCMLDLAWGSACVPDCGVVDIG